MKDDTQNEILEIVTFLKDNAATKQELAVVRDQMVTKLELDNKLDKVKSEIMTHMDGFIGLHQKLGYRVGCAKI